MKKIELLVTQKHEKGDILKGSIYIFQEESKMYTHTNNEGVVVSMINDAAIEAMPGLFKKL